MSSKGFSFFFFVEYVCHSEGGATALGYSQSKQRLFCGGKKGDLCILRRGEDGTGRDGRGGAGRGGGSGGRGRGRTDEDG